MAALKTALVGIETIALTCPYCSAANTDNDSGSEFFTETEYNVLPEVLTCTNCGHDYRKPVNAFRRPTKPVTRAPRGEGQ